MTIRDYSPTTAGSTEQALPLSVPAAIEARHAVRKYKPQPIPDEDLERILQLTGLAPSAFNVQPWRFVVVRDPALKQQLQAAAYNQPQVGAAAAVIVLYSDMADALANLDEVLHPGLPAERREPSKQGILNAFANKSDAEREAWGAGQTFIALGFLLLAAQSLGYASSPMGGFDPEQVRALLGLPAHAAIPAIVALGVADEPGFSSHRHPLSRIVREAKAN
jgi:nitroreductase